jgi:hypothetical protein
MFLQCGAPVDHSLIFSRYAARIATFSLQSGCCLQPWPLKFEEELHASCEFFSLGSDSYFHLHNHAG